MTRIGRYRVEAVVGTGAFATVHRAADERLGDTVAVKVLAENHSLDPEIRDRFLAEGRVLRRIDSPHVVRVHDLGETERQQPFLVLEHADRGTLLQRVDALRASGWQAGADDVLAVARPLAAAVEAVHRADLVHRDLSPGNVLLRSVPHAAAGEASALVRPDERLVLADLGLCKDLAVSSGLTVAGGTEGFRPPEQRRAAATVDGRADLWALSALLLWLVTGAPPGDEPPPRRFAGSPLPPDLARALGVSLATDPARRHRDVAAWLEAVETALRPPAPPPAAPAADTGPRRRPRWRGWALLAVALLLAGAVALLALDRDGVEVSRLDDGRTRTVHATSAAAVAVVGPDEVAVGDTATFTVEVRAVEEWVWIAPDGRLLRGAPSLTLRADSVGPTAVGLLATTTSGDRLEVEHALRVTDP